jgi:hypothetical protein
MVSLSSVATSLSNLEDLDDGTDLAVVLQGGTIERWQWRDGVMQKDGHRLPPFFFSGLLAEGKVMPGNFTPPMKGEWFQRRPQDTWLYLVVAVESEKVFRCGYFRRGQFYDWRAIGLDELLDNCLRIEAPEWANEQYLSMTYRCANETTARIEAENRIERSRTARNNMTYARDYLNQAIELMERR